MDHLPQLTDTDTTILWCVFSYTIGLVLIILLAGAGLAALMEWLDRRR